MRVPDPPFRVALTGVFLLMALCLFGPGPIQGQDPEAVPAADAAAQFDSSLAIVQGLDDPEPVVKVHTLGESSVDFVVRPWCRTDDYWDVTRAVKMRFDEEGISIPFPQRDVHLFQDEDADLSATATTEPAAESA